MNLKALAKDTALYGISSIVGRFLNYLLVPLYTYKISVESGGYGIVTNLYAYSALLLVILTFGMETTFFRFSGKNDEDGAMVFSTSLRLVGGVSALFLAGVMAFLSPISAAMGYGSHPEYIACFAVIVALDAFQSVMFARLRQQRRPLKFVALKLSFIIVNVALNLFVFLALPTFFGSHPSLQEVWNRYDNGVGFIFLSNLICTALVTLGFIPEMKGLFYGFDRKLARRMLSYTWPLLFLGLIGILNQVADKIMYPHLVPGAEGQVQLGIYGACVKIAMIMTLLTQAFRYAYEPIVFSGKEKNSPDTLSQGMKYFILFALLAWLAVMVFMPVLRHFIQPGYWEGLSVVPVVMMAEIFMGVYFNLSFWYKLSDKTWWGALFSAAGAAVMIAVNVWGVPRYGYMACAWGGFAGYGVSMALSFIVGRKKYPIPYDFKVIIPFTALAVAFYFLYSRISSVLSVWAGMAAGTVLLLLLGLIILKDIKKSRQ